MFFPPLFFAFEAPGGVFPFDSPFFGLLVGVIGRDPGLLPDPGRDPASLGVAGWEDVFCGQMVQVGEDSSVDGRGVRAGG